MPRSSESKEARSPKARLSSKVLRESSAKATKAASKRAFKVVASLVVVQNGRLVRVDHRGKVLNVIKTITAPKP